MRQNNTLSRWLQRINNRLAPGCLLCSAQTGDFNQLCDACYNDLPDYPHRCKICAISLPPRQTTCGQCQVNPPRFDHAYSPYRYQAPVRQLIHQLKYGHKLHVAGILGDLLADFLQNQLETTPDVLIPVPLHRKRIIERGFNQSNELARRIQSRLGIPINNQLVKRRIHTESQTGLNPKKRKANIAGAFQILTKSIPSRILIIDDVLTTGMTSNELAKCLKKQGAISVDIAAVARAER